MAPSIQGVPVVIEHPDEKITDESIKNLRVVGRVADMHYSETDELWYAHFVVDDSEAVKLLQSGYGVSTAWIGKKYGQGGTFNNVPYDRELIAGRYEHLAIVRYPRYEMAKNPIFQNSKDGQNDSEVVKIENSKKKGSVSMFGKLFRKITQKEEIMVNSNEEYFVEIDGVEKPLKEVIDHVKEIKKNACDEKEEKKMVNGEEEIDVDGEKMTVNQLIEAYKSSKTKKNEDEKKEDKEEEKKENSVEEQKKDDESQKRFDALDDAHKNGPVIDEQPFMSLRERTEAGKSRYGSKR